MSTNKTNERSDETHDPTKDKYLEMEKKVGTAEYEFAADLAADKKALDHAMKARRGHVKASIDALDKKAKGRG